VARMVLFEPHIATLSACLLIDWQLVQPVWRAGCGRNHRPLRQGLVCKRVSPLPPPLRSLLAALVRLFRGHVAQLLRQPYGADVITDLYDIASTSDRNALCAEFYGREFVLFDGISGKPPCRRRFPLPRSPPTVSPHYVARPERTLAAG
jgi:hypothetical protein